MEQKIISDSVIDELSTFLKKQFSGLEKCRYPKMLHIEASNNASMGWIEAKKEELGIPQDYNVLIEYQTCQGCMKFVMHGNDFVCMMLAEKYGGKVSDITYWIMYNEPQTECNHGYKEKLPTAEEIINFVKPLVERRN